MTGLLSGARRRGGDPRLLLQAAGIDPGVLRDPGARVPIAAYAGLYNLAARRLGDEAFGLLPEAMRPGAFEFLCRGVVASPDLGEALRRAARFLRLVAPALEVALEARGAEAVLAIREAGRPWRRREDPRRVFAFEWLLRLLHALACWLVARPIPLRWVRFPFRRPPHAADYALVYTEHSAFDAPLLEAAFDAGFLALPVRRDDADLAAFLEGAPGKITLLYRRDREAARAVREHLAAAFPAPSSLARAARELRTSARTLHRRLRDEGTSFRAIREALRRERALSRLERSDDSIAAIAADLGYSEPSAFFRAFVGWTGEAPSAHRRRLRRGG